MPWWDWEPASLFAFRPELKAHLGWFKAHSSERLVTRRSLDYDFSRQELSIGGIGKNSDVYNVGFYGLVGFRIQ
jgi:hypothetical protein